MLSLDCVYFYDQSNDEHNHNHTIKYADILPAACIKYFKNNFSLLILINYTCSLSNLICFFFLVNLSYFINHIMGKNKLQLNNSVNLIKFVEYNFILFCNLLCPIFFFFSNYQTVVLGGFRILSVLCVFIFSSRMCVLCCLPQFSENPAYNSSWCAKWAYEPCGISFVPMYTHTLMRKKITTIIDSYIHIKCEHVWRKYIYKNSHSFLESSEIPKWQKNKIKFSWLLSISLLILWLTTRHTHTSFEIKQTWEIL